MRMDMVFSIIRLLYALCAKDKIRKYVLSCFAHSSDNFRIICTQGNWLLPKEDPASLS